MNGAGEDSDARAAEAIKGYPRRGQAEGPTVVTPANARLIAGPYRPRRLAGQLISLDYVRPITIKRASADALLGIPRRIRWLIKLPNTLASVPESDWWLIVLKAAGKSQAISAPCGLGSLS